MCKPSSSQNSTNFSISLYNILKDWANTTASSANNNNQSYTLRNYTISCSYLLRYYYYKRRSIFFLIRSKNIPNRSGEHGQPYFRPIVILIGSKFYLEVFTISARKLQYISFNALTKSTSKFKSSIKTVHKRSLDIESYALERSTNTANRGSLWYIARSTIVFRSKQLSSTR